MALHHEIKPHHHASVWAVCLMVIVGMGLFHASVSNSLAEESHSEPSQKTKEFFGVDDDKDGDKTYVSPSECQEPQVTPQSTEMEALKVEMDQLGTEMTALYASMEGKTSEEVAAIQAQIDAKQARIQEILARIEVLGQELQNLPWSPSLACKTAIVNMMKADMTEMKTMMDDKITTTFVKVDTAIAKIEAKIPALKDAGVDPTIISGLETNIQKVKTNETVLKGFFSNMTTFIDEFLLLAGSNPEAAFDKMQGHFDSEGDAAAATAADNMVDAFTEIERLVNLLN